MRHYFMFVLAVTILVSGCAAPTLKTEIIPSANLDVADFKTYTFEDHPMTLIGVLAGASADELEERVKHAINFGMDEKGYTYVSSAEPYDIAVSFLVGALTETQTSSHQFTKDRWAYNATFVWTQQNDYLKGALSIVMRQPTVDDDILWQGTAADILKNKASRNRGTVDKFSSVILEQLPPSRVR